MSRIANDWVWKQNIKPATHKLILLAMADRADEYHCCYPSIARLERDTGLDRKTIQKGISNMIACGLLSDTGKRVGTTNKVRVLRMNIGEEQSPKRDDLQADNHPKNGNVPKNGNNPKNGTLNDPNFGTLNDPKNGMQNHPIEPPNEPLPPSGVSARVTTDDDQPKFSDPPAKPEPPPHAKPKRQSREEAFVAFVVERGVDEETARCWWQYRDGKPMTSKAWERHCAQADAAGISPQAAADYTAGREWRAFYADGYLREVADTELVRRQGTPQGRVFDQAGNPQQGGIVPAGMPATFGGLPAGRTSKMSQGLAALEEMKAKIDRGEI